MGAVGWLAGWLAHEHVSVAPTTQIMWCRVIKETAKQTERELAKWQQYSEQCLNDTV